MKAINEKDAKNEMEWRRKRKIERRERRMNGELQEEKEGERKRE